jgi:hypothetical protein
MAETTVVAWMNTYTAGRWARISSSPCTLSLVEGNIDGNHALVQRKRKKG